MIKGMYRVYDSCAAFYGPIMSFNNDNEAMRDFTAACVNEQTQLSKFPEHYTLVFVGNEDDSTGEIIAQDRVTVITALEARAKHNVVEMKSNA